MSINRLPGRPGAANGPQKTNEPDAKGVAVERRVLPLMKLGKAEAAKMTRAIATTYDTASQKKVLHELFSRATGEDAKVSLTADAAGELNKLARKLGLSISFVANKAG